MFLGCNQIQKYFIVMITTNKLKTVSRPQTHNDWSFLPTAFSALAGVGIGIAIGNYLGWF